MIIRNSFYFKILHIKICCDLHLNRLIETVQMRGHNIWLRREIRKIIIKYSLLSRALIMNSNYLDPVIKNHRSKF